MTDSDSEIEELTKQIAELRSQLSEQLQPRPRQVRQESMSIIKWKESIENLVDKLGNTRCYIFLKERSIPTFGPIAKIHRDMLKCCLQILMCKWSVYFKVIVPENAEELWMIMIS